ncbi:MAG: potassium/proton antiporter [Lentisphaeria bacterium]|nr:potassium/proton antiporter [Lentisphaeria bacterium]
MELCTMLALIGVMLIAGALSNKLSSKFNVPILILFLFLGGVLGYSYIPTDKHFNVVNIFGTIAMSFILFAGGLDTSYRKIKDVLLPGGILSTLGVVITAVILGLGTWLIAGDILIVPSDNGVASAVPAKKIIGVALLLGAMISSTDAAAVFAILSGRSVGLKGKLRPMLELESGSNDPMAYFLTVMMVDILLGENSFGIATLPILIYRMAMGVFCGVVAAKAAKYLYDTKLEYEGLYFVFSVAIVLCTYGFTEMLQANGMMACYVCGVAMNYFRFNYQKGITRFSDGVSWLMQVALFTSLGLFLDIKLLPDLLVKGTLLAFFLMLVARPLSVMMTMPSKWLSFKEKIFVSWVGLRGAAPIVLATFPLAKFSETPGEPAAKVLFNLIFIMVVLSLVIQGTTLMPLAKKLKLDKPVSDRERSPLELEQTSVSRGSNMFEFIINENCGFAGRTLAELELPSTLLVTMLRRKNTIIQPRGATKVECGDGMTVMGNIRELIKFAEKHFPEEAAELASQSDGSSNFSIQQILKRRKQSE